MQIFAKRNDKAESEIETSLGTIQLKETPHDMYFISLKTAGSSDERVLGTVSFAREKVKYLKPDKETYEILKNRMKMGDWNRIIQVDGFFPFKDISDEELGQVGGKGVGTAVLNHLVDEWRLKGFAAVYCYSEDSLMQKVLDKLGFEKIGVRYFKDLRSKVD